jgi:hypothetical protein
MSSCVFYKFRNSKDAERILFHGTTISVFELKREIMLAARLGDGTDINLHIYPEDQPRSEYTDDTTLIPRSSTVIAARRPAPRGQGRAARYVSARAPVRAIKKPDAPKPAAAAPGRGPQTEQDAEAAFLAESAQLWEQQKESLSHAKPIFNPKKKHVDVPNHDPPPGYVCYRCQKKGHWIQACPTNDDPDFKPAARAKRTTGIPRSFLKTVAKPADDDLDNARGVMLNADGEYVQVMTDTRTWEKFQEKATTTKAQAAKEEAANREGNEGSAEPPKSPAAKNDAAKTTTPPATEQPAKPQPENERPGQKRKTPPTEIAAPTAPKAMRQQPPQQQQPQANILDQIFGGMGGPMPGMPGMPMPGMPMPPMPPNMQGMPPMPPNMQGMPPMPPNMQGMQGMPPMPPNMAYPPPYWSPSQ